jgi:hypothetical protein
MSGLISCLFSGSPPKQASSHSQSFSLHPSPKDKHLTIVHPTSWPKDAPPLYSVVIVENTQPNISIFQGAPGASNTIGDSHFTLLSSTTNLTLRGKHIRLKRSQLSGDFTLDCIPLGTWKWTVNKLTGSSMKLCDNFGNKLAEYKSVGISKPGEKRLEILVPCDKFFVELVVLSVVTAKSVIKTTDNAILEGLEAIAGI